MWSISTGIQILPLKFKRSQSISQSGTKIDENWFIYGTPNSVIGILLIAQIPYTYGIFRSLSNGYHIFNKYHFQYLVDLSMAIAVSLLAITPAAELYPSYNSKIARININYSIFFTRNIIYVLENSNMFNG